MKRVKFDLVDGPRYFRANIARFLKHQMPSDLITMMITMVNHL